MRSMTSLEQQLQRLAMNDDASVASLLGDSLDSVGAGALDAKTRALVRLGALVTVGAPSVTYQWATQLALAAGASDEEIMGTFCAVSPVPSLARIVSAAPELAAALGYAPDEAIAPPNHWAQRG
jgi:alkylhydroperoxidase/carboxymuconolactone decarboxylase family protein YurZ